MIITFLFDFSRVLLFPKDRTYLGSLNSLHKELLLNPAYNIFEYFELNQGLLNFIKNNNSSYNFYIFTTDTIQNTQEIQTIIKPLFQTIFSAKELTISKKDSASYMLLAEKMNSKPENILFIDDNEGNINAAQKAGFNSIHFISNEQLFKELEQKYTIV